MNDWATLSNNTGLFNSTYTSLGDGSVDNLIAYGARHALANFPMKNPDANVDEYILAIKFDYALGIRNNASGYALLTSQGRPGLTRKFVNSCLMNDGSRFTDQEGWETMTFSEETGKRLRDRVEMPNLTFRATAL